MQPSDVANGLFRHPRVRIRVENLIILRRSTLTQVFHATKKAPRRPLKFIEKHSDSILLLVRSSGISERWRKGFAASVALFSTVYSIVLLKELVRWCVGALVWCTSTSFLSKTFASYSIR